MTQLMGRPGPALDNAVIESWHSTVEFELRRIDQFATQAQARSPPGSRNTTATGGTPAGNNPLGAATALTSFA